jgi:hypothetical protein
LIHLLRLTQSPQLVKASGPLKIFEVKIPGGNVLYIAIDKFDLNKHILPGLDYVFILDAGDPSCIYFILRESGCPRRFKLITSFHSLFLTDIQES